MSVLIAYYPLGEIIKVAKKFEELFKKNDVKVILYDTNVDKKICLKKQFKKEKQLSLEKEIPSLKNVDLILIGTPIISFTSVPAINIFIRSLPNLNNKKIVLFATGIGLPGNAIKKMSSLLSMKNANVIDSQVFFSIFEFDSKKMLEIENFFNKFYSNYK
ncbi:MAG: hypothetical protein PHX27_03655 [Candidatus ainarchaeum sp.]|nr:hypothetical protein [Candidatus ainarchaeum sp.]